MNLDAKSPTQSALLLGALGVVFGDIGTSPLYTMKEAFGGHHALAINQLNIYGVLSMVVWALMIVVSIKYVLFIMRADNRGEGGTMALIALVHRLWQDRPGFRRPLIAAGIFGVALFYGDGIITPAVSVLSAVEGIEVAAPKMHAYIVPIAIGILLGMFAFQYKGTTRIGKVFGPIMILWFGTLATLGILQILREPSILAALSPHHAVRFSMEHGWGTFFALGAVVLAFTGAEALYADMGHFGRKPIRRAWFAAVLPALVLNYLGQGALLLSDPASIKNPFFLLAPGWLLIPLVVLATAAAVIASQAVITGAFSMTRQAIQLGFSPRMEIRHTSESTAGQIYLPLVNRLLMIGTIGLVLAFGSASNLAAAYGIAVTGEMIVATILAGAVFGVMWKWPWWLHPVMATFLVIDLCFFGANLLKFFAGGWFPLALGVVIFAVMFTWRRGRKLLLERMEARSLPLRMFITSLEHGSAVRVPGTAIFMTGDEAGTPSALLHNLKHNKVLHARNIILRVESLDVPVAEREERISIEDLGSSFWKMRVRYGFAEDPNVPRALFACSERGLDFDIMDTTFFLSRETLVPSAEKGMPLWQDKLYAFMARNATTATQFFSIPTNRFVELGAQVEI